MPAAITNRSQLDDNKQIVSSEVLNGEQPLERCTNEDKNMMGTEDLDEFDEFEEGVEDDEFGDFNDNFEKPKSNEDAKPLVTMNDNVKPSLPKLHLVSEDSSDFG